ncbi:uncharacterized protein APUU_31370S [Aspergillus puulaauensis]|uniref:Hydrophobin n=1 Tax=Aspergillus puulaauensis TaxID=1220207 RepID=A0A7R7XKQ2_9EURO|nr:uncharacterized protein APUU_31370S [Aspergillus puulaauensis]BCS23145.1 hypothetical protein APUU_31370S [Aspergillus puulaauensis]
MKFTVATFVTLVAAAAAMPSSEKAPQISQKSLKKIDETKNKCGDATVNCCVNVPKDTEAPKYDGLSGLLHDLLAPDTDAYCQASSNQGLLGLGLQGLLGGNKDHICDTKGVTYVCCNGGECNIPTDDKEKEDDY